MLRRTLAGLLMLATLPLAARAEMPSPARQRALLHLLRQDCGACHGLTLKGGLGPALLPAALADKPPAALEATITHGRPGTPMPPFRGILSDAEVEWLVAQLRAGLADAPGERP